MSDVKLLKPQVEGRNSRLRSGFRSGFGSKATRSIEAWHRTEFFQHLDPGKHGIDHLEKLPIRGQLRVERPEPVAVMIIDVTGLWLRRDFTHTPGDHPPTPSN